MGANRADSKPIPKEFVHNLGNLGCVWLRVKTEKQSEDLLANLTKEMEEDPTKVWELNMFGKSMHDMVKEGLQSKLYRMPEEAQMKLQEALQKIINEGSGGLVCIFL